MEGPGIESERGFSALATGWRGEARRTVLFDVGPSADAWLANARRLAVDLAVSRYYSKRPDASRLRSYRRVSGNGGNQDSRRMIQLS